MTHWYMSGQQHSELTQFECHIEYSLYVVIAIVQLSVISGLKVGIGMMTKG